MGVVDRPPYEPIAPTIGLWRDDRNGAVCVVVGPFPSDYVEAIGPVGALIGEVAAILYDDDDAAMLEGAAEAVEAARRGDAPQGRGPRGCGGSMRPGRLH